MAVSQPCHRTEDPVIYPWKRRRTWAKSICIAISLTVRSYHALYLEPCLYADMYGCFRMAWQFIDVPMLLSWHSRFLDECGRWYHRDCGYPGCQFDVQEPNLKYWWCICVRRGRREAEKIPLSAVRALWSLGLYADTMGFEADWDVTVVFMQEPNL